MLLNQRSMLRFEQSIKSKHTLKNYTDHLELFLDFSKLKDYDSLINMPQDDIQMLVEEYVVYLKKKVSPNSVQTMMTGVKHFFIMNRISLFWELIQKMYPEKVKRSGFKAWDTSHIRKMLDATTSKRTKAIIHFLASSGSRIGVFDYDLTMKHLKNLDDGCKGVLIYAGEIDEYWAFLTPEASDALELYFDERKNDGESFSLDSPIFRIQYSLGFEKAKPMKKNSVISIIWRSINKSKIKRERVNRNFDIQQDHGFRKRFNTIMKLDSEINSNLAEKILGHSVTHKLDNTYFTPSIDDLFNEFKKAIPELIISEAERQKIIISKQKQKISKLESRDLEIEKLKTRLDCIERLSEIVSVSKNS